MEHEGPIAGHRAQQTASAVAGRDEFDGVADRALRVVHTGASRADPRTEIPVLGYREYWYPLVSLSRLKRRRPQRVKLLGDELCVFRGKSGPAVLTDICPHRGARLSAGRCHYAGTVSCPYHGWTFAEGGECVAALSEGPKSSIPGRVKARSYPSVALKGLLFVWMGDGQPTDPRQDLPPELFDESTLFHDATIWEANWRTALENMNDHHVRDVHRNAIQVLMRPFSRMSYQGARAVITGGGVTLTHYKDDSLDERPYQEHFSGVEGLWPIHRYRLLWSWIFPPSYVVALDAR